MTDDQFKTLPNDFLAETADPVLLAHLAPYGVSLARRLTETVAN